MNTRESAKTIRTVLILALASVGFAGCSYLSNDPPLPVRGFNKALDRNAVLDFSTLSNEVLKPKCLECHKQGRHPFLTSPAAVQNSIAMIRSSVESGDMPEAPMTLTDCERAMLFTWLDDGAPETSEKLVADLPACAQGNQPEPTPEPSPAPSPSPTPDASPTATPDPTQTPEPTQPVEATFTQVFDTVLSVRCIKCHDGEDTDTSAFDIPLNTEEQILAQKLVIPGSPETSLLIKTVLRTGAGRMPPGGNALTAEQIELLQNWVKSVK